MINEHTTSDDNMRPNETTQDNIIQYKIRQVKATQYNTWQYNTRLSGRER